MSETDENRLARLVERDVFQSGTRPIREGRTIAVKLPGGTVTLVREKGRAVCKPGAPAKPDLTFIIPSQALARLETCPAQSIGDVGIEITKLLMESDPSLHMRTKVHIGLFDMVRYGYLGVIPLGGPAFMKFLSAKGFGSMSKIRDVISKLRS